MMSLFYHHSTTTTTPRILVQQQQRWYHYSYYYSRSSHICSDWKKNHYWSCRPRLSSSLLSQQQQQNQLQWWWWYDNHNSTGSYRWHTTTTTTASRRRRVTIVQYSATSCRNSNPASQQQQQPLGGSSSRSPKNDVVDGVDVISSSCSFLVDTDDKVVQQQQRAVVAKPTKSCIDMCHNDDAHPTKWNEHHNVAIERFYGPSIRDNNIASLSGGGWKRVEQPHLVKADASTPTDGTNHWAGTTTTTTKDAKEQLLRRILHPVLPAQYPLSVAPEYATYSLYSFLGAVAGSASMVLSTQTLLLTLVVGSSSASTTTATAATTATTTAVAGGALNWILKDGVGQLGGVIVSSRLLSGSNSSSSNNQPQKTSIDTNPKWWRLLAAITLDVAAGLELLTPFVVTMTAATSSSSSWMLLGWACGANILKNVGFVAVSASRAALHQNLAWTDNLADVTAKSASQGMVAGLIGTIVGVSLSTILTTTTAPDATSFLLCYGFLAIVHQTCVYQAVSSIAFRTLNQHRLFLVLHHYVVQHQHQLPISSSSNSTSRRLDEQVVLTPRQVAALERWLRQPLSFDKSNNDDASMSWLSIGSNVQTAFPRGPEQLMKCVEACPQAHHVVNYYSHSSDYMPPATHGRQQQKEKPNVHLVYLDTATTGPDIIMGMLHACILRKLLSSQQQLSPPQKQTPPQPSSPAPRRNHSSQIVESTTTTDVDPTTHRDTTFDDYDDDGLGLIRTSYEMACHAMQQHQFIDELTRAGWDVTMANVEDSPKAVRIALEYEMQ